MNHGKNAYPTAFLTTIVLKLSIPKNSNALKLTRDTEKTELDEMKRSYFSFTKDESPECTAKISPIAEARSK